MANSLNTTSPKATVFALIENLILLVPLTVDTVSTHGGLVSDLSEFYMPYRESVEREGATPETALELYARTSLAMDAVRLINSYHEDNFVKVAKHLQACYQAIFLLEAAPAAHYVSLNMFIGALLSALPDLEQFSPVMVGTPFTRNAMLAMAYEIHLVNPNLFQSADHLDYQNAFNLKAKQVMARFAENKSSAFVPADHQREILVENEDGPHLRNYAVNATQLSTIAVEYSGEDGYFGLYGDESFNYLYKGVRDRLL